MSIVGRINADHVAEINTARKPIRPLTMRVSIKVKPRREQDGPMSRK
jgi:hypothetical protein